MLKVLPPLLVFLCACFKVGLGQTEPVEFPVFFDDRPISRNEQTIRSSIDFSVEAEDDALRFYPAGYTPMGSIVSPNGEAFTLHYIQFQFANRDAPEFHIRFTTWNPRVNMNERPTYTVISPVVFRRRTSRNAIFANTLTEEIADRLVHEDETFTRHATFGTDWVLNIVAANAPQFSENMTQNQQHLVFCGSPVSVHRDVFAKLAHVCSDMRSRQQSL